MASWLERWPGWALVLVPAVLFFVGLEALEPRYFLRDDNALYYLPAYVHDLRAVVDDGELAHLNLFQYQGIPHLAAGQTGVLYPPVYLAVALAEGAGDVRWAVEILVVLHLLAAALGMYLLLRHLGLGTGLGGGAWAGALLLPTLPFLVLSSRAWVSFTFGGTLFVWSLWALLRWHDEPTWRRTLAVGAVFLVFVLTGYPQLVIYAGLYGGLLLLALWTRDLAAGRRRGAEAARAGLRLGVAALLTLALSAPLLLPMWRATTASADRGEALDRDTFLEYSLRPEAFAGAQAFSFRPMEIHSATSSIFHVGLPVLLGLVATFRRRSDDDPSRHSEIRLLAFLALLAWVASTEAWGVVYGAPLLSSFRWPFKHFLFFVVLAVPAAAASYEALGRRSRLAATSLLLLALAGNLTIAGVEDFRQTYGILGVPDPVESYRGAEWSESKELRIFTLRPPRGTLSASLAPHLRVYDYATLVGEEAHFAGYFDPLLSVHAHRLALGSRWGALPAQGGAEGARLFAYLGRWGVSTLLAPADEGIRAAVASTGAAEWVGRTAEGVDVFRNLRARPVVENLADGSAVAHRRETNGVRFETAGDATRIRVAVRSAPGWSFFLDGERQGPVARHPEGGLLLDVPAGRHAVRLHYEEPGFGPGLVVASLAALVLLGGWWIRLRFGTERPAPNDPAPNDPAPNDPAPNT